MRGTKPTRDRCASAPGTITGAPIAVRWTIGDVSPAGFEALRLSIWGARRVFGGAARLAVCVNSVPLERARAWAGPVPAEVSWHDATRLVPAFMAPHLRWW